MDYSQLSIETLDRAQECLLYTLEQVSMEETDVMPARLIKSITWLLLPYW